MPPPSPAAREHSLTVAQRSRRLSLPAPKPTCNHRRQRRALDSQFTICIIVSQFTLALGALGQE